MRFSSSITSVNSRYAKSVYNNFDLGSRDFSLEDNIRTVLIRNIFFGFFGFYLCILSMT